MEWFKRLLSMYKGYKVWIYTNLHIPCPRPNFRNRRSFPPTFMSQPLRLTWIHVHVLPTFMPSLVQDLCGPTHMHVCLCNNIASWQCNFPTTSTRPLPWWTRHFLSTYILATWILLYELPNVIALSHGNALAN